jgi:hypothetical protein
MKTLKQANAIKTLLTDFSSAVKISKVESIEVSKSLMGGYDIEITPSIGTNIEWLADTLNDQVSTFAPLVAFLHDDKIIIS